MKPAQRKRLHLAMVDLADGHREAFDTVFAVLWPTLRRVACGVLGPGADAEDAAQQALIKLFANASRFEPERAALPWAIAFVLNECRSVRNRQRRRGNTRPLNEAMLDPAATPERQYARAQLLETIETAAGTLTTADREALGLTQSSGEVKPAAARKRKQRALGRLREVWRNLYGAV